MRTAPVKAMATAVIVFADGTRFLTRQPPLVPVPAAFGDITLPSVLGTGLAFFRIAAAVAPARRSTGPRATV